MNKYALIFVILVYRNYKDLEELLISIRQRAIDSKCIIVDAFYDDATSIEIKNISSTFFADYLAIPNKGYSYGNNIGIDYAKKKYLFDYLIVSNPDIVLDSFDFSILSRYKNSVIGPKIVNLRGKKQNPMYYKQNLFVQKIIYNGLKNNNKKRFFLGIAINKIIKRLYAVLYLFKKKISVYQLHGSFVIFHKDVLQKYEKIYDENMFLFAEESMLAVKLKKDKILSIYDKRIKVRHKEDGSMVFRNDINSLLRESNLYVFEKYYMFGEKR